jgi:hypothetical protein
LLPVLPLAGIVVYAGTKSERFPAIVLTLGVSGLVLTVVGVLGRWSPLLSAGLVGVGAAYALFLGLRPETVDPWAPFVAAALFSGAELGFSALGSRVPQGGGPRQRLRGVLLVAAAVLGTAILGSALLLVGGSERGGVALEAGGLLAAVTLMAIVAGLAARQGRASKSSG